jgi:uncharacterized protein YijF (DUF1287 family)
MDRKMFPALLMVATISVATLLLFATPREQPAPPPVAVAEQTPVPDAPPSFQALVLEGARDQVQNQTEYRETYESIGYPGGDVPAEYGVCTDLVVRAFRHAGVDLQQALHEDRKAHPQAYPTDLWEYKKPDRNIDHRRCQNLVVYFSRFSEKVDHHAPDSWEPGDVIFFVKDGRKHPWHVGIIAEGGTQARMIHLFPTTANEDHIDRYGPVHSVWRWREEPAG